jgi:hypothetical protein
MHAESIANNGNLFIGLFFNRKEYANLRKKVHLAKSQPLHYGNFYLH